MLQAQALTAVLYLLLGMALGAGTGVPPGPTNLAVINSAHRRARALAIGCGGALGDTTYAALGILGLGPILARHPTVPPVLQLISGIALMAYGASTLRSRPAAVAPTSVRDDVLGGLALGATIILLNPSSVVTWVVIVGSALDHATALEGGAAVLGVGLGSFSWFAFVTALTRRGLRRSGEATLRVARVVSVLLIGYGAFSLVRGIFYFV